MASAAAARHPRPARGGTSFRGAATAAALLAVVVVAAAAGALAPQVAPDLVPSALSPYLIIGLAGLVVLTFLCLAAPVGCLVAAFALLSVVRSEPAPVDLLFVLLILTSFLTGRRPRTATPPVIAAAIGVLALLSVASMFNAIDTSRAVRFEGITLYLMVLGLWLSGIFRDRGLTRRLMKVYILTALFSAALGILALKAPIPSRETFLYGGARAKALFKDPNVLAPFLVPAAAIVLEEIGRPRLLGWGTKRLVPALLILIAGSLVAFSRAGWLNLGLALTTVVLIYLARSRGFTAFLRTAATLGLAALAGYIFLAVSGLLGFLQERSHLQIYDQHRFATQALGLADATRHVFGYGPGQVEANIHYATHSLVVRVVYEQGVLGLAALTAIVLGTLLLAITLVIHDEDVHGVGSAALLGSWLGLIANSFFIDSLHWRHLWIVAALIWCGATLRQERIRAAAAAAARSRRQPEADVEVTVPSRNGHVQLPKPVSSPNPP
jgi:hypothetical protein